MSRTISNTYTTGITLISGDSPITITNAASITGSASGAAGIFGNAGTAWDLTNQGHIIESGSGSFGISLAGGGTITNLVGGVIFGVADGVKLAGAGATVVNAGSIGANAATGAAISLAAGGSVTNQSGGTVSGYKGIVATGSVTAVVNAGRIIATEANATNNSGVTLAAGGSVTNAAGGTISGISGVVISGGAGTVVNLERITANLAPANYDKIGIYLANGGAVTNGAPGGTVSSAYIAAYQSAVRFGTSGTGTLTNYGTLRGSGGSPAVVLTNGTVINGASGATGAQIHVGGNKAIEILGTGTVINFGTINNAYGSGPGYYGVFLHGAGVVTNLGTASLIVGYNGGIYGGHDNTVTNGGTISSSNNNNAVKFAGGTNRLIVNPGAKFIGQVTAAGTNTLELASAASTGTLSGLGTQFVGFQNITVDAGASWSLTAANLGTGYAINNAGTLIHAGTLKSAVTLGSAARLSNASTGTISVSGTAVVASAGVATVVNSGKITAAGTGSLGVYLAAGGTVTNQAAGTITGVADAVKFKAGYTSRLVIAPSAVFSGTVDGGNTLGATSVSTLELASSASAGTLNSLGSQFVHFANLTINSGATWTLASGTLGAGYTINDAGNLTNAATLGSGITLGSAARLTNASAGVISTNGTPVVASTGAATVVNAGRITGASAGGFGVYLSAGGTISNQAAGTISGGDGAVKFKSGFTNRLMIAPTAVFSGTADGGNTIGTGSISTLELTSSASAGTLTGLGSSFVNFAQVTVDNGGSWTLSGTSSGFASLTNAGKLQAGVTLGSGSVTVSNQSTGTISNASVSGNALYVAGALVMANAGSIVGGTSTGIGVYLAGGGTLTNQASGRISGGADAVKFGAGHTNRLVVAPTAGFTGTVDGGNTIGASFVSTLELTSSASTGTLSGVGSQFVNFAQVTIDSGARWLFSGTNSLVSGATLTESGTLTASGTFTNSGLITGGTSGVIVSNASTVTNTSGGAIAGTVSGITASGTITVVNAGSIGVTGTTTTARGVTLNAGVVSNQSGGTITSGFGGVFFNTANATLTNAGVISGINFGVDLDQGGIVTNLSSGTIAGLGALEARLGVATMSNAGVITGGTTATATGTATSRQFGVYFGYGGRLTNQVGGTISGFLGFQGNLFAATVANYGLISGGTAAFYNSVAHTFAVAAGVYVAKGGTISNLSGGTISGQYGIEAMTTAAIVSNAGVITGVGNNGVYLAAGGTVTNLAGGTISGGTDAVKFKAGFTSRLVIRPSAVFSGIADGGNTIGATSISTLELASGASAGTLTGLGSQFINFAATTIDANADWALSGSNSLASGATLTNAGTLTDTGTLTNAGVIAGNVLRLSGGTLTNQAGGQVTAAQVYGLAAGGADAILNRGTIANNSGFAIIMGAAGTVTNTAGALISGNQGIRFNNATATLTNLGRVAAGGTGAGSYGVYLRNGGLVTNGQGGSGTSTASIQGYYGIAFKSVDALTEYGTLINFGTVIGNGTDTSAGVALSNGGTVFNGQSGATGALIEGTRYGVATQSGPVVNYATIIGTGTVGGNYGVNIQGEGFVSNVGTASLIEGYVGVKIDTNGTVTNAGTIASNHGSAGVAVQFTGGAARLIDNPDAVFIGSVVGGSADNTLELASGSGTVTSFDTNFVNFHTIVVDAGANWALTGIESVSAFKASETIVAAAGSTLTYNGEMVCFCAATNIRTPDGEVAVENLAAGDLVITADGTPKPVRWIGQRRLPVSHDNAQKVSPVRIQRDAIADGMPHRDLLISPDHAVLVDGMLICARQLMNGSTIRREADLLRVHYFHIELDDHAILFAEGMPAESYLDTGNRGFFDHADAPRILHPNLIDKLDTAHRQTHSCAPFVTDGRIVEPVWQRLARRAAILGQPVIEPLCSRDPELHVVAIGQTILPMVAMNGVYSFAIPQGASELRLVSRAGRPTDCRPWLGDGRRLGVPVTRLMSRAGTVVQALPLDHLKMTDGWWETERDGLTMRRWTNGDAVVPLPACGSRRLLEVHIGGDMSYILPEQPVGEFKRKIA